MDWPPFFALDLNPLGLLPAGWEQAVETFVDENERHILVTEAPADAAEGESWSFSVVTGDRIRAQLEWLWSLYHGQFKAFASEGFGSALYPANRLDATTTLNILEGRGGWTEWHRDANPVSGLFFATGLEPGEGGELQFRSPDGEFAEIRPRAGLFVCFAGSCEHQVAPLQTAKRRLSIPMTYYTSPVDQPFASENNRYQL